MLEPQYSRELCAQHHALYNAIGDESGDLGHNDRPEIPKSRT